MVRRRARLGCVGLALMTWLGVACGDSHPPTPTPSIRPSTASPTSGSNLFFDRAPQQLVAGFAAGIGGNMACSGSQLVFTNGRMDTLYSTSTAVFAPRELVSLHGFSISPISMAGTWAAFTAYRQAGDQLSPLAAWTVYAIQIPTGRVVRLATGTSETELREMPVPSVGDGFIVWDELMPKVGKVLWLYDLASHGTRRLDLPASAYPVYPSAAGKRVLFLDNSRDPHHASEVWVGRGGEPMLLDIDSDQVTGLAPGSTVFDAVLTATRAVWINGAGGGSSYKIQELLRARGRVQPSTETASVAPILVGDGITIWLAGPRGATTAHAGSRTALVSPDLIGGGVGMALCGSDLYYAGPHVSLRVAHIG